MEISRKYDIFGEILEGQHPNKYLTPAAKKTLAFLRKCKEDGKYPLPWDEKTFEDPNFRNYLQENYYGINSEKSITTQDGFLRVATMMNYLAYSQEISEGIEKGPAWEYLDTTKGMEKKEDGKFKPGSAKAVNNKFLLN